MKVANHLDTNFLKVEVGMIVEYPDNSKEEVIFKSTDKSGNHYLTQIQTNKIKKNGELGKLTSWLKFNHYELA
jgi:hypothetical protein